MGTWRAQSLRLPVHAGREERSRFSDTTARRRNDGWQDACSIDRFRSHVARYLFSIPTRFPATRMAGYTGVESYVELVREDGTLDYGYLVSVRGNPDAAQDEPDLMLYVIRDAAVARAKGLAPYGDEKSFLALARSIAATVKRRPVAAGAAR